MTIKPETTPQTFTLLLRDTIADPDTVELVNETTKVSTTSPVSAFSWINEQPVGEGEVTFSSNELIEGDFYTMKITGGGELSFYGLVFCTATPAGDIFKLIPDVEVNGETEIKYNVYEG